MDILTTPEFIHAIFAGLVVGGAIAVVAWVNGYWSRRQKRLEFETYIGKNITEMFQIMEYFEENMEKKDLWELRRVFFCGELSKMREFAGQNYVCLKRGQFAEFIEYLTRMEKAIEQHKRIGVVTSNKIYEMWLEDFKEIEWIKIPMVKLDFRED